LVQDDVLFISRSEYFLHICFFVNKILRYALWPFC
jgi:hypothetical protein